MLTLKTRSPPSSCADDVRKIRRPLRPRVASAPVVGRPGQDLELVDRRRALAVRGAEAVGAGVAAADDHDVLARGA